MSLPGPAVPRAGLRAEDLKLRDPVPVADFGQTSLVNVDAGDNYHGFRLAPEGSHIPHLGQVPREPDELVAIAEDSLTKF
jgi:hypothetical protein